MITLDAGRAYAATNELASRLAKPPHHDVSSRALDSRRWLAQSLARGATEVAALHIERAYTGSGGWDTAHAWLSCAARDDLTAGPGSSLFFGAPAVAFALNAAADRLGKYERALATLDSSVAALIRQRLTRAHLRIDRQEFPALGEFDLIHGLAEMGAHLLRRPTR